MTLASLLCRQHGALRLVVVAKACFLLDSSPMSPTAAPQVVIGDAHHGGRPNAHVVAMNDLVPAKARVDVTALASACAPVGSEVGEVVVRLALLQGGGAAIDKTLVVRGPEDGAVHFERLPITWERARGGPHSPDNPIGADEDDGQEPNVFSPNRPAHPAGFGPIAAAWPCRRGMLGGLPPTKLQEPIVDLPDDFDWRYFQAAPADQQLDVLAPDAVLVLDGLHPERRRIEASLGGAQAVGTVFGLDPARPERGEPLAFRSDTLHVDGERLTCTVTWRAHVPLASEAVAATLLVCAGIATRASPLAAPTQPPGVQRAASPWASRPSAGAPAAQPGAPAADASRFFHDVARLAAVEALLDPAPLAPPPSGLEPWEEIELERCAAIAGKLASPGTRLSHVLAVERLQAARYRAADRHWRGALAHERMRGKRELGPRYDEAFVTSWEADHPDAFVAEDYFRLARQQRRGTLAGALQDERLDMALWMRLRRVWEKRVAADPQLRARGRKMR